MVDGPPQPADDDNAKAQERRRLVRRLAVAGPLVLGLLVLLLACVLWIPRWLYPPLTETTCTARRMPPKSKSSRMPG